jgi:23S rRNA G2445 N2-methylase RlmL
MAGGRADKRRKLYNGMIQCTMYHYFRQSRK